VEDLGLIDSLYATAYYYLFKLPFMEMTDEAFIEYVSLIMSHDWTDQDKSLDTAVMAQPEMRVVMHSFIPPVDTVFFKDNNECQTTVKV